MVLVAQRVIENLLKRLKQGCISHSFHCRRHFYSCALVKKMESFNIKGGSGTHVSSILKYIRVNELWL